MVYVLGIVWIVFACFMVAGMLTGRVRVRSCCGFTDASCDLRLRDEAYRSPRGGDAATPPVPTQAPMPAAPVV